MTHYVYMIVYENRKRYIGVRSCEGDPKLDPYMGSSKITPVNIKAKKRILQVCATRQLAVKLESAIHHKYQVHLDSKYYNQVCQTSSKFDQQGCTAKTHPHIKASADKQRGRTANEYEYIRKANIKRKAYVGNNRTKAQIEGSAKQAEAIRGIPNPAKGHPGATSTSFVPWYFIDPKGNKTIVTNISKKDYACKLGVSYRQLIHRFHKNNEHKPLLTIKSKNHALHGYTFGNLKQPSQTIKHKQ